MKTITCLFLFSLLTGIAAAEELMSIWEAHDFIEETEHVSRQKQQEVAQRSIPSHSQTSSEEMTIWEAHDLAEAMEWEFTRDAIPPERPYTIWEASNYMAWVE